MSWFDPPALVPKPMSSNLVVFPPEVKKHRVFVWVCLMAMFVALIVGAVGFALGWVIHLVIPLPFVIRQWMIILFALVGATWGAFSTWSLIVESVHAAQHKPSS